MRATTSAGLLPLHVVGAAIAALCVVMTRIGPLADAVPTFLGLHLVALALLVPWALRWSRGGPPAADGPSRTIVVAVLVWATIMRLALLLGTEPTLSDDVFRYVWEGRVVALGLDPYDLAPDDPLLASLAERAPEWELVNHRHLPALYPPVAQWLFGAVAAVAPSVGLVRAVLVLVDLALVGTLAALLAAWRRDPRPLVLYAWHPLVVVEVASSGHFEPWGLLWTAAGLLLLARGRRVTAFAAWGLALATKIVGVLPAAVALTERRAANTSLGAAAGRAARDVTVLTLVATATAVPFLLDGRAPVGSLPEYAEHWTHFASLHPVVATWVGTHPARRVVAWLFVAWVAVVLARRMPMDRALLAMFVGLLVCSPVVHPWYGLWICAVLPLAPSAPALLFSGLLPLSYLAFESQAAGGPWLAPPWAPWVAYGVPALLALALRMWRPPAPAATASPDPAAATPSRRAAGD